MGLAPDLGQILGELPRALRLSKDQASRASTSSANGVVDERRASQHARFAQGELNTQIA